MAPLRVLITGGGRGIGRAAALRFAKEGAHVVVAARTSGELDDVVAEIDAAGGKGLAAQMNVTDLGSVEAAVWRATEFTGGPIDVLINNAGVFDVIPFDKMGHKAWSKMIDVNLTGAYYVTQESLNALEEGERTVVINVASGAAKKGFPGNTAYCASKYGLKGFGDALRIDLAEKGIRVVTVYPRGTDTTIFDGVPGDWDRSKMNSVEEVAEVIFSAVSAGDEVTDIDVPPPAGA
ncbi:MAG: SDR family NAD(P)-dependent oxidoreductase [Planctomycetota bacterium]|jgi:3-oxoacyl-[acyl-carrier protein] reductase|nr:SDR family NAD(P)-dependent oxidoreductase [Planctomycetota bacterium]